MKIRDSRERERGRSWSWKKYRVKTIWNWKKNCLTWEKSLVEKFFTRQNIIIEFELLGILAVFAAVNCGNYKGTGS